MTRMKEIISKNNPKLIVLALGFIGFIIGIALGVNFASILLITIMLFLLMMYVRTSDNYGEYNIGSNSVKFLSSVTFLLCWIITPEALCISSGDFVFKSCSCRGHLRGGPLVDILRRCPRYGLQILRD